MNKETRMNERVRLQIAVLPHDLFQNVPSIETVETEHSAPPLL